MRLRTTAAGNGTTPAASVVGRIRPGAIYGTGVPRDDTAVVVAVRPRHRARGRCSCGWVGPLRVLLASAKVDALVHAACRGCEPAIPLVRHERRHRQPA
jgi:hypothetical protein